MGSIKKNFIYSSILTVSNFIFPLLVFPYISRVLGVNNIGICNFIDSIINYFIIISMMGINTLGVRLSSKYRNNRYMLNKAFTNLFIITSICTVIIFISAVILIFYIPKLYIFKNLMFIGLFKILFTLFTFEWFFRGIENFKYITSRGLVVRILYVIAVFIFVRSENDIICYYTITVLTVIINSIIECIYIRNFVSFSFDKRMIKIYIKPFFVLGVYTLLTSMYTSFNVAYLGFVAGEKQVGFYTTAIKLYSIWLALFSTFTGVMLPRMSILVNEKKFDEQNRLVKKSFDLLFTFSLPIIICASFFAPMIIRIIAGVGFEGAILPMRIVMPLILIIGIEEILIIQLLMPLKKDSAILINSLIGAFIGLALNFIFVSTYKSVGSSIVLLVSEISVLITSQFFIQKFIGFKFPFAKLFLQIIQNIPTFLICLVTLYITGMNLSAMVISFILCAIYFFIIKVFILKNDIIISLLKSLKVNSIKYN